MSRPTKSDVALFLVLLAIVIATAILLDDTGPVSWLD